MWKVEENFPRGGAKKDKAEREEELALENQDPEELFKEEQKPTKKGSKALKRKKSDADVNAPKTKKSKESFINSPLSECLEVGLRVLGCVQGAHEYSVTLSLPGNHVGSLPITEISPAYTRLLQGMAQAAARDEEADEEVKSVDEMFCAGMLLPVVVTSQGKRSKLSCAPAKTNSSLNLSTVQDGMLLCGSVSSVEDHGYRVDLGVTGLQAFLTDKDADKFIQANLKGEALTVGHPVWCVMKKKGKPAGGASRSWNVTIDPDVVKAAMMSETTNLDGLLPGMKVTAVVEKVAENGLFVKVGNFDAVIHGSQLSKSVSSFKVNKELSARVLYVNPVTKVLQLTALPALVACDGSALDMFHDLRKGAILEARVSRVEQKKGVYFSLPGNVRAFSTLSQLTDKSEKLDMAKFSVNATHQCRVMDFNYMEGVALVTLKKSIIAQKYLTIQDLSVGEVVETVVKEVTMEGVCVSLSQVITSFIRNIHLTDVPIKNPEKKFESGMKLKCRVLRLDTAKNKVWLTHKKSLVRGGKYPAVWQYDQLQRDMELEGVIVAVKEKVVIVAFFGDVKGFVKKCDMSTESRIDPGSMFYVGQLIRCRVVYVNAGEEKLRLSFNFGRQREDSESEKEHELAFGEVIGARIISEERFGFKLSLQQKKGISFLPFSHLSDFEEIRELRRMAWKKGHRIDQVTHFKEKTTSTGYMTVKECFLKAAEQNKLVRDFADLKAGQRHPAVIKNHQDFRTYVGLAGGHVGICKRQTQKQGDNLVDLLRSDQSVTAQIVKLDATKKRFQCSLRLRGNKDCREDDDDSGDEADDEAEEKDEEEEALELMVKYLGSRGELMGHVLAQHEHLSCYSKMRVGEIVGVSVTNVLNKGILGELQSGAQALATTHHFGDVEPVDGESYEAAVLFVDVVTPMVELSLDPKLIESIKQKKSNDELQLKAGQVAKADVVLIKPEFLLLALCDTCAGSFVYVPARKYLGDVEPMKYKIGDSVNVQLHHCFENLRLATILGSSTWTPKAEAVKLSKRQKLEKKVERKTEKRLELGLKRQTSIPMAEDKKQEGQQAKQDVWIEKVHAAIQQSSSDDKLKDLLQKLLKYSNIPKKEKKFKNFMETLLGGPKNVKTRESGLIAQCWDVLMTSVEVD